jgi:hypothetical protein
MTNHLRSLRRAAAVLCALASVASAQKPLELSARLHERVADERVEQAELTRFLELGLPATGFEWAFRQGEEFFEAPFTALDGGGANVGGGQRYTRVPRSDLKGPGEWATHVPPRTTGPNATSCSACHSTPYTDGSGGSAANVHRDPLRNGKLGQMIQRSSPHLFGSGALQRLAEEMSEELVAQREAATAEALRTRQPAEVELSAKGVTFGNLRVVPKEGSTEEVEVDTAGVRGVATDLVVRPYGWKGDTASLREFTRKALNDEIGIQAIELVGASTDGDHDGVADEFTVGEVTALTLYIAGQPRPTTRVEMAALGILAPLPEKQVEEIQNGELLFQRALCAACHVPELPLADPVFREPSRVAAFRDERFPGGQDPRELGVDPEEPMGCDLTEDLPDNDLSNGHSTDPTMANLERLPSGGARVALFGDLRRHDMGPELAETIDEIGTGASSFLTENLWGVGSTGPYLHDGRATTLAEAILFHGGEAADSRDAFLKLDPLEQSDLLRFLENLVLYKIEPVIGPDGLPLPQ